MNRVTLVLLFLACVFIAYGWGKGDGRKEEREIWQPIVKVVEIQAKNDSLNLEILKQIIPTYKLFFEDSTWDELTQAE